MVQGPHVGSPQFSSAQQGMGFPFPSRAVGMPGPVLNLLAGARVERAVTAVAEEVGGQALVGGSACGRSTARWHRASGGGQASGSLATSSRTSAWQGWSSGHQHARFFPRNSDRAAANQIHCPFHPPAVWTSCARPKVLGCGTRWDKAGRMRDKPRCLLGFFVAPTADGGSRLLVGVFPPFGDFRGEVDGF